MTKKELIQAIREVSVVEAGIRLSILSHARKVLAIDERPITRNGLGPSPGVNRYLQPWIRLPKECATMFGCAVTLHFPETW